MKIDQKSFDEALAKAKEGVAHDLREAFSDKAPKASGFLMRNIDYKITEDGIEFSFPYYAVYLEYGTGLYIEAGEAGRREKIYPKTKKALAFKYKGKEVVVKYVKGMTPRPFIRPVLHQQLVAIVVKNLNKHMKDVKIIL